MPKTDRIAPLASISIILLIISYWFTLVTAIIGKIEMSIFGAICYAVSIILLEYCLNGKNKNVKKRLVMLLEMEGIQLIPYVLILVIRSLIG